MVEEEEEEEEAPGAVGVFEGARVEPSAPVPPIGARLLTEKALVIGICVKREEKKKRGMSS